MKGMLPIGLYWLSILLLSFFTFSQGHATGVVDRVYKPNILPLEKNAEWRLVSRNAPTGNELLQRIGYGHALTEGFLVQGFVLGERDNNDQFGIAAYEIEVRWMIGQQGQYWADTAVLLEIAKDHHQDQYQASLGLINEKQWGRTILATNLITKQTFGADSNSVLEAEFRMQYRYLFTPAFQPALEFYSDRDFQGIGPGFMGVAKFSPKQHLKWELAFIKGVNGDKKDHTLRASLEWTF